MRKLIIIQTILLSFTDVSHSLQILDSVMVNDSLCFAEYTYKSRTDIFYALGLINVRNKPELFVLSEFEKYSKENLPTCPDKDANYEGKYQFCYLRLDSTILHNGSLFYVLSKNCNECFRGSIQTYWFINSNCLNVPAAVYFAMNYRTDYFNFAYNQILVNWSRKQGDLPGECGIDTVMLSNCKKGLN